MTIVCQGVDVPLAPETLVDPVAELTTAAADRGLRAERCIRRWSSIAEEYTAPWNFVLARVGG